MEGLTDFDYFSTILLSLNSRLETLCDETDSIFLREMFEAVDDPGLPHALRTEITSDGAHFNYDGYGALGRAICAALEDEVSEGDRILLLGDSITAGYPEYEPLLMGENYGDERHSFGYFLRTVLGCEVANRGISGDLTSNMVGRLGEYLVPPPDLVVLQGGANDAFWSLPFRADERTRERATGMAGEIFGNFKAMVEKCKERDLRVAVVPLLPFFR